MSPTTAPPSASDVPALAAVLEWEGYIRAGAVQDIPGHLDVLAGPGHAVWNMSFHLGIDELPELLEIEVDWVATAARLMLMAVGPEEGTPPIYEAPQSAVSPDVPEYTDKAPICMRLPIADLTPGTWSVMAHSQVAVDANLRFTIRSQGGAVRLLDDAHVFTVPAFAEIVRDHEKRAPEPCEPA